MTPQVPQQLLLAPSLSCMVSTACLALVWNHAVQRVLYSVGLEYERLAVISFTDCFARPSPLPCRIPVPAQQRSGLFPWALFPIGMLWVVGLGSYPVAADKSFL